MAEAITKLPVKTEDKRPALALRPWRPFENLRREIDRLFDIHPFLPHAATWTTAPAVDIAETEKAYEITAELPGMDEKNIEVNFANGILTVKGEKQEETEEKKKDYYLSERTFGSFQRSFQVPDNVDADKIEANFKKGVLKLSLPKNAEAQKAAKKIVVKAA